MILDARFFPAFAAPTRVRGRDTSPHGRDALTRGLLTQRSLSPDAGRGADAERQGLTRTRGTSRGMQLLKELRLSPDILGGNIRKFTPSNIQTRVWILQSSLPASSSSTIWRVVLPRLLIRAHKAVRMWECVKVGKGPCFAQSRQARRATQG